MSPRSEPAPGKRDQEGSLSGIEQLIERIGARYVADLRELSEAFARFYQTQLAAKDQQIVDLSQSLAAAQAQVEQLQQTQHEHDTLASRLPEVEHLKHERDALAARLHDLERTRFQIMRTLAHDLGTVSFAPPDDGPPDSERLAGATPPAAPSTAPSRGTAQLVVLDRVGDVLPGGTVFPLRSGMVVGRWASSDIEIDDAFISADHARLTWEEGRWWVTDLGSTNGTFVNGARIDKPTPLSDGDEVRFGRVRTRLAVKPAETAPRRAPQPPSTMLRRLVQAEPGDPERPVESKGGLSTG